MRCEDEWNNCTIEAKGTQQDAVIKPVIQQLAAQCAADESNGLSTHKTEYVNWRENSDWIH